MMLLDGTLRTFTFFHVVLFLLFDVFSDAFEEWAFAGKHHWRVEDVIWSVEKSSRVRLSRVPGVQGRYGHYCTLHLTMTLRIIVKELVF